jgi:tetratricopeptide (TPR) repeat protein
VLACLLIGACGRSASYYASRGNELFAKQKYEAAELNYRKALQKDPKFGEAYYRLGLTTIRLGKNPRDGYRLISRGVELLPDNDEAKIQLANLALSVYIADPGHPKLLYDRVAQLSGQLLAKDPDSFDALCLKAALLMLDRKPEQAIPIFRRSLELKADNADVVLELVHALFQTNAASEAQQLALALIGRNKSYAPAYDVLYLQHLTQRRFPEAEKVLKLKVANNPGKSPYVVDLARHYWRVGRTADSTSTLQPLLDRPADFPDGRLQAGRFYGAVGDWKTARQHFQAGLNASPQSDRLVYQKALLGALAATGERIASLDLVNSILQAEPQDQDALRMKAKLLLQAATREDIQNAIQILEPLVQKTPKDAELRDELGRAYLLSGDSIGARAHLEGALKVNRFFTPAALTLAELSIAQANYDEALARADEVLTIEPGNQTAGLLRAEAWIGLGKYEQAENLLARMSKQYPQDPSVHIQLGLLLLHRKKYREAEIQIRRVYQARAKDPRAPIALAEVLAAQAKTGQALELLQSEIKNTPNSIPLLRTLSRIAGDAGHIDLALDQYSKLIAQQPGSAEYYLRRGQLYRKKGNAHQAVINLEKASQLAPADPLVAAYLADALLSAGRRGDAKAKYRVALGLQPDNPVILNNLAMMLSESDGDLDEAQKLAEAALRNDPNQLAFRDTLGWVYLRKGMTDSAIQTLNGVVSKAPSNPTFAYHLGLALSRKGQGETARKALEAALRNNPNADEEKRIRELLSQIRP